MGLRSEVGFVASGRGVGGSGLGFGLGGGGWEGFEPGETGFEVGGKDGVDETGAVDGGDLLEDAVVARLGNEVLHGRVIGVGEEREICHFQS